MDYRTTLVQTWKTLWQHKSILIFGLIPFVIPGMFVLLIFGGITLLPSERFAVITSMMNAYPYVWLPVVLVLGLLSVVITAFGDVGISKGTRFAWAGSDPFSFRKVWAACWPYLGRFVVLLLSIGFVLSLVTVLPALLGFVTAGLAFICFLPFLFVILPGMFLLQSGLNLVMSAVVADDLGVIVALRRTGRVIRTHFWPLVLMALILNAFQAVFGILVSSPLVVVQSSVMLLVWNGRSTPQPNFQVFGLVSLVVILLILIVQSFISTFIQSAWMLVYLRLTGSLGPADEIHPIV